MFGRRKLPKGPKSLVTLSAGELKNILEQERLVADAIKVQRMLSFALNGTMKAIAEKHKLPKEFELDRSTGEIFKKESE